MLKEAASLILKHTATSRRHLTPELALRLITPDCPLWRASEEEVPFKDPFWAFYWPGGQATARFILDNGELVKNRNILDVGCGCGAGSIAAAKMKAKRVLANDIDDYAVAATEMNAKINDVSLETSTTNLVGDRCVEFDTILIGDMFYDEEFANLLFEWLHTLSADGKTVLIGDPGRHGLTARRRHSMTLLAKYRLPEHCTMENNGFTHSTDMTRTCVKELGTSIHVMVLIGDPGRHGLRARRRHSMTLLAKYRLPEHSTMENNGFTHSTVWRLNKLRE